MEGKRIGFAVCGSFCTFAKALPQMAVLREQGAEVIPIMSEISYTTDTRFGKAQEHIERIKKMTGAQEIIHSVCAAEPIGPKKLLDALVIAPCTGNTLAKLALGVTDSAVAMAAKAHLRNQRQVLIAVATNDGLSNSLKNIGLLMNTKNIFFVPFGQDDANGKPNSLVADFAQTEAALRAALEGKQLQPVLL